MMDAGGQAGEIKPTGDADKFDADGKATILFIRDEKKESDQSEDGCHGIQF